MIEVKNKIQNITAPEVTISLDAETCFILSQALMELGDALSSARRKHLSVKRFHDVVMPQNRLILREKRDRVKKRLAEIGNPPLRTAVKALRVEFSETWDGLEFQISDIRREERQAAREGRDREISKWIEEGLSVKVIAERLNLSQGTVRNILSRIKKAPEPPAVEGAPDA